jgi:hypothetical protein
MAEPIQLPDNSIPERYDEWVSLGRHASEGFVIIVAQRTANGIQLGYDNGTWPRAYALQIASREADRLGVPLFILKNASA